MKKLLGTLLLAAMSCSSMASSLTLTTTIDKILITEDTMLMYVYPQKDIETHFASSLNECHDQSTFGTWGNFVTYKMTRSLAKEYFSMLNSAFVTQKKVDLVLKNECTELVNSVSLSYLRVHN